MTIELPATPDSVAAARHWLTGVLVGWSLDRSKLVDARLVCSELVTNAIEHGVGDVSCRLVLVDAAHYRLSVIDADAGLPRLRDSGPDEPGGRGLQIVDRLADSWGVAASRNGKAVWAILAA